MGTKHKLVLVWVENTGMELTGRYRDRLSQVAETRAVSEAKAARFSDVTPAYIERIEAHVAQERHNYTWMGYYILPDTANMLQTARDRALVDAAKGGK